MPRLPPRTDVLRALFARSGNRCAFPGCAAPLINERNQFIAQVCHIESAEEAGERFNPEQTDEQRRSYDNLILLCYPHHVETNEVALYAAERLRSFKSEHERVFGQKLFQVDESLLHKLSFEMEEYWRRIDVLHREQHIASDLAMEVDAAATYLQLADAASGLLDDFYQIREHLIESDRRRARSMRVTSEPAESANIPASTGPSDFEVVYIGFANTITKLSVTLTQMEIKYLEEYIKLNPGDHGARQRLEQRKVQFAQQAASAGYVD
jgi:hypothetical protein